MIGDTPETDIRGANGFGMKSALITKTGIMAERVRLRGLEKSLQGLPSTDFPTFLIEKFGY